MHAEAITQLAPSPSSVSNLPFLHRVFQLQCLFSAISCLLLIVYIITITQILGIDILVPDLLLFLLPLAAICILISFWSYKLYRSLKSGRYKLLALLRYCIVLLLLCCTTLAFIIPKNRAMVFTEERFIFILFLCLYITILVAWIIYFGREHACAKNKNKPLGIALLRFFAVVVLVQAASAWFILSFIDRTKLFAQLAGHNNASSLNYIISLYLVDILFALLLLLNSQKPGKNLNLLLGISAGWCIISNILLYLKLYYYISPTGILNLAPLGRNTICILLALIFWRLYTGKTEQKWLGLEQVAQNDAKPAVPKLFFAFLIYTILINLQKICFYLSSGSQYAQDRISMLSDPEFILPCLSFMLAILACFYTLHRNRVALLFAGSAALVQLAEYLIFMLRLLQSDNTEAYLLPISYLALVSSLNLKILSLVGLSYIIFSPRLRVAFNYKNMSGTITLKLPLQTALFILLTCLTLDSAPKFHILINNDCFKEIPSLLEHMSMAFKTVICISLLLLPVLTAGLVLKKEKYKKTFLSSLLLLNITYSGTNFIMTAYTVNSIPIPDLLSLAFVYFYAYTGPEQEEANYPALQTTELQTA